MIIFANARERAFENMQAVDKLRLVHAETGELLHLSGNGTTRDTSYSWLGFKHQADNLKAHAEMRGETWPYMLVHRDELERAAVNEDMN